MRLLDYFNLTKDQKKKIEERGQEVWDGLESLNATFWVIRIIFFTVLFWLLYAATHR